ncbi:MAG: hypothetical protein AAF633_09235 [Chloroflexota bacterium]
MTDKHCRNRDAAERHMAENRLSPHPPTALFSHPQLPETCKSF